MFDEANLNKTILGLKYEKEVINIRILNYNELTTLKTIKKHLYEAYEKYKSSRAFKDILEIAQNVTTLIEASCDKTGKIEAMTDELEQIINEIIANDCKEDKEALISLIIAKEQLKTINKPLEAHCNYNEGSKHDKCTYKKCIYKR